MLIANFTAKSPTMGDTRTYEDFYKFLAVDPVKLGMMARLYPENTTSFITETLGNLVEMDKAGGKFRSINALSYDWETEVNYIKRVEFAEVPETIGENGSEIRMMFRENYYSRYDIFKIDKTRQQCFVLNKPRKVSHNKWEYIVRILDGANNTSLILSGCQIGDTTRFQSNAMPEGHEEGYVKWQTNVEKHRNYITTHRVEDTVTSLFAATEDRFVTVSEGKTREELKKNTKFYKLDKFKKNLFDNFMYVRDNGNLFNKTSVDANGKSTIFDYDLNRPIYIGDGLIPQIERFAGKYSYSKLTINSFNTAISQLVTKAKKSTGNRFMVVCNDKAYADAQRALFQFLTSKSKNGTWLWSKSSNGGRGGYVDVGATFESYQVGGNIISFKVDRSLSYEHPDKGYMMMVDLTTDLTEGTPAVEMFTLKGGNFISNRYLGVGGDDGLTSGDVSSPVAASRYINWGYSSIAAYAPYKSYIMREA